MTLSPDEIYQRSLVARHRWGRWFYRVCFLATTASLCFLLVLLVGIVGKGWPFLNLQFLTNFDSALDPTTAGIKAGLWGSFWLTLLTGCIAVPIGVGAAIYLEEYARPNSLTRLIQLNIANLAGVPSIVYGILGLTVFVRMFDLFGAAPVEPVPSLPFGKKLLSGAMTLSLLILPVIIIAAQEALRAIPASLRHASLALGATRWQTIRYQVLPAALPGILTGVILALSRAAGETAPLIMIGALSYIAATPGDIGSIADIVQRPGDLAKVPFDLFAAMPLIIYNWASQADPIYEQLAAAGIVVLLSVLLLLNTIAIRWRHRIQKRVQW